KRFGIGPHWGPMTVRIESPSREKTDGRRRIHCGGIAAEPLVRTNLRNQVPTLQTRVRITPVGPASGQAVLRPGCRPLARMRRSELALHVGTPCDHRKRLVSSPAHCRETADS